MTDERNYELLAGDTVCAKIESGKLTVINEKFAPLFLCDFPGWVNSRSVAKQRGLTSRNIKRTSGISATASDYDTAMKANCACITDNYWVREVGSDLTYADVNYDKYDGALAQLSLGLSSDIEPLLSRHPELTNIGNSDKAWITEKDGVRWLYKHQPLRECLDEILASKVAKKLGINTVEYKLVSSTEDPDMGRWGIVRSKDFTQGKRVNLEHAECIAKHFGFTEADIRENAKQFCLYGLEKDYLDIVYLDIIVGNPDRHLQNYGVLRSQDDGSIVGFAPNYDNNFAFRSDLNPTLFCDVAAEYGYIPPILTEEHEKEIEREMMEITPSFDVKKPLNGVRRKERSIINEIEKHLENNVTDA